MVLPAEQSSSAWRDGKSATAYRTISEVANTLDLPQHVLRFWESKFPQIKPMKRGGGRRYYRPEDLEILRRIKSLLYDDGYTIKGAQKLLHDNAAPLTAGSPGEDTTTALTQPNPGQDEATREKLREVLDELVEIKKLL